MMGIEIKRCPLCKSKERETFFDFKNSKRFLFNEYISIKIEKCICVKCGHIYCNKYPSPKEVLNHYENTRNAEPNLIYNKKDKLDETYVNLVEWMEKIVNGKSRNLHNLKTVLDIGCGKCDLLKSLNNCNIGLDTYGIDISPQSRIFAQSKGIGNIYTGSIFNNPFENKKFDIISATGVIEHQTDLKSFIKKIANFSKKGTYILVEVPDSFSIIENRADLKGKYMHDICNDEHVHHFSLKSLKNIFESNGFTILADRKIRRGYWEAIDLLLEFTGVKNKIGSFALQNILNEGSEVKLVFNKKRNLYKNRFNELINKYDKIGIYGAGWHTSIVLPAFFELDFKKIAVIYDKDPRKSGKRLFNKTVTIPNKHSIMEQEAILISTIQMTDSIKSFITELGVPKNKIISIYDEIH